MTDTEALALSVSELVDQLVSVQFYMGGGASSYSSKPTVRQLYDASRELHEQPLSFVAASGLAQNVSAGDYVMISTGFSVPPVMIAETDGPIGAAALARAVTVGLGARVIIVTEDYNIPGMMSLVRSAGLNATEDAARQTPNTVLLQSFPIDREAAVAATPELLDRVGPKAIVTIEKPSQNRVGVYHNGAGIVMTDGVAKFDLVVDEARNRGIFTIGIGDGGNEIGMGNIEDVTRRILPPASDCGCPCGEGIAAATKADVCMVGAIANWGAYAIEAVLATLVNNPAVLHSGELEARLLDSAARLGMVDPTTCLSDGYVDGLPGRVSQTIVESLNTIVGVRLDPNGRMNQFRSLMQDRASVQAAVDAWAKTL